MSIPNSDVRSYFERWENLEDKKDEVATDLKELFAEAKANGHDTKAMRAAFRQKVQMDDAAASKKAEAFDETVGLYLAALIGTVNATRADRAQSSTAPRKDGDGSGAASAPRVNDGDGEPQNSLYPKLEAGTQAPPVETVQEPLHLAAADPLRSVSATRKDAAAPVTADEAEPTQVEASSAHRVMTMTPLEPREAGGLKGFGFTVKFEDKEPASSVTPKRQWKHSDPPHRDCLRPELCGGHSNIAVCQACREAATLGQVA